MNFLNFLFSSYLLLLWFAVLTVAQPTFLHYWCFYDTGNYTSNSIYKTNLDTVLSSLDSEIETRGGGFYNFSVGQAPDRVEAKALCRGDVGVEECKGCIRNSTIKVLEICPNKIDALVVYDFCTIRYSNRSILGVEETSPIFKVMSQVNASDVNEFTRGQQTLLNRLRGLTSSGDSTQKFAVGSEGAGFKKVYGLMQCSPDLSRQECDNCLGQAIGDIAGCCSGKLGGSHVIKPSCQVWFDDKLFYQLTPSVTPSTPPTASLPSPPTDGTPPTSSLPSPPTEGKKSNMTRMVVIIVVPTVSVVILAIFVYMIFLRVRKPKGIKADTVDDIETAESLQLDFDIISDATNNFSDENKLGQGGFGAVYKGIFPNGEEIAVKRLSRGSGQGEVEFKNEVLLVAKLQHRNLVRLLGFCLQGEERLLVYEFVPNSSLNNFIFDPIKRVNLNWPTCYKIIRGIARGLVYLHEDSRLRIIHRDLKASNILLDEEMNPKISDFGMARLFAVDQTQDDTSRIVGTFGYMAPEYVRRGHFSVKLDVFSFGVLILEIVSSQKNTGFRIGEQEENLLTYAWRNWNEGTTLNLMDPTLFDGSRSEVMRCIHIGLLCVQESEAHRPTMAQVMTMLSSNSITLLVPSKPAFFIHTGPLRALSSSGVVESRSEDLSPQSRNEVSITELDPR